MVRKNRLVRIIYHDISRHTRSGAAPLAMNPRLLPSGVSKPDRRGDDDGCFFREDVGELIGDDEESRYPLNPPPPPATTPSLSTGSINDLVLSFKGSKIFTALVDWVGVWLPLLLLVVDVIEGSLDSG